MRIVRTTVSIIRTIKAEELLGHLDYHNEIPLGIQTRHFSWDIGLCVHHPGSKCAHTIHTIITPYHLHLQPWQLPL